jgi:hypothetical protein
LLYTQVNSYLPTGGIGYVWLGWFTPKTTQKYKKQGDDNNDDDGQDMGGSIMRDSIKNISKNKKAS